MIAKGFAAQQIAAMEAHTGQLAHYACADADRPSGCCTRRQPPTLPASGSDSKTAQLGCH